MNSSRLEQVADILGEEIFEKLRANPDFAQVEQEVLHEVHQALCSAHQIGFSQFDESLSLDRPKHLVVKDYATRTFLTLAGPISICRRRYFDKESNTSYCLADRVLDMNSHDKVSAHVANLVCEVASETRYESSIKVLEIISGHTITRPTVKSLLAQVASTITNTLEKEPCGMRKVSFVECEADEIFVSLQQRHTQKSSRRPRSKGVKVISLCEGREKRSSGGSKRVNPHFIATTNKAQVAWKRLESHIEATYHTTSIKQSYLGVDGATWSAKGQEVLPGRTLVGYDVWHVLHNIKAMASKEISGEIIATLKGLGVDAACLCVRGYADFYDSCYKSHSLDKLITFLQKHKGSIEQGLARNLGAQESTNAKLVGSRLKNYGGAWSTEGIEAMVVIRAAKASGQTIPLLKRSTQPSLVQALQGEELDHVEELRKSRSLYSNAVDYYHKASVVDRNPEGRFMRNLSRLY